MQSLLYHGFYLFSDIYIYIYINKIRCMQHFRLNLYRSQETEYRVETWLSLFCIQCSFILRWENPRWMATEKIHVLRYMLFLFILGVTEAKSNIADETYGDSLFGSNTYREQFQNFRRKLIWLERHTTQHQIRRIGKWFRARIAALIWSINVVRSWNTRS